MVLLKCGFQFPSSYCIVTMILIFFEILMNLYKNNQIGVANLKIIMSCYSRFTANYPKFLHVIDFAGKCDTNSHSPFKDLKHLTPLIMGPLTCNTWHAH